MKAIWNGVAIARSDDTVVVEGNHYFPLRSVGPGHLVASTKTTRCPWKGKASYFHVEARGERSPDAAWTYRKPWPLARRIKDRVAFGDGVAVEP